MTEQFPVGAAHDTPPSMRRAVSFQALPGRMLLWIIATSLSIHAACLIAGHTVLSGFRWMHYPVHAAVEMSGSLIALAVAWMLLSLEKRRAGTSFNIWIASALIGMGLLDGIHALVYAGQEFVWLHSTATFVGGVLFVLVWVPRSWSERVAGWWPQSVAVVVVIGGVLSLMWPDQTPAMLIPLESGDLAFSVWAKGLNIAGGVLLLTAAVRLVHNYRVTGNADDLLFCLHCSLFGAAAIMFEQSQLWDLPWWGWHVLRLMAYGVALWFLVLTEIREQQALARMTEELQEFNRALELRVEHRTAELRIARDAAESASRAKSEFLANMSHEIRTPLNAVIGLTEIVMGTRLDDVQRDYLSTVIDSAESLLAVINDILDFSRIEAGKLELEQIPFSVHDVVGDTLRTLAVRAHSKDLELLGYVDPGLPQLVVGDPGRLRQIIINLVGNAIKFTERGEIEVRVERESHAFDEFVRSTEPPDSRDPVAQDTIDTKSPGTDTGDHIRLQFQIRDTGIGFAAETRDRLFYAFEQADSSTARRFGGTGLGLSICARLVHMMGGRIGADSVPGDGSTFYFTAEFGQDPDNRFQKPAMPDPRLRDVRILFVSTSDTGGRLFEQLAGWQQMRPESADCGDDAIGLLRQSSASGDPFRIVVADLDLPDFSGLTLTERIRSSDGLEDTEVILLTIPGQPAAAETFAELRIAAQVSKPVRQSDLFHVLSQAVRSDGERLSPTPEPLSERRDTLPRLRILLAEDSPANRKLALAILRPHHDVEVVTTGQAVLQKLDEQDFDVVLMDIQMPELDRYEATARIRQREHGTDRHQQIVALTAHAMKGDRERCLQAGMDDYIPKPIRRVDLNRALSRVATALGRADPAPAPGDSDLPGPPSMPPQRRAIDWAAAMSQMDGNADLLLEVVDAAVTEIREHAESLQRLIGTDDSVEIRRRAHTLTGTLRLIHADDAQRFARTLEELAAAENLDSVSDVWRDLKACLDHVLPELERFLRVDTPA